MAKRTYKSTEKPTPKDVAEKPKSLVIMKPYIDTLNKDTQARDVKADKLPGKITVRFKRNGAGETTNRYIGKSGTRYDFHGGVPLVVEIGIDKVDFVLKAKKNPEVWEIIGDK